MCIFATLKTSKTYIIYIMNKSLIKIASIAMLMASVYGCTSSEVITAADTKTLMTINRGVDSAYNVLKQSYEVFEAAEMDNALAGLNTYLETTAQTIKAMEVSDDCKELQKAISDKVQTLQGIAATDSKEQVRIYKIPDTDFTGELRQQWDEIAARVDKKVAEADANVKKAVDVIETKQSNTKK